MMKKKRKNRPGEKAYQELKDTISKILKQAEAKGVPIRHRRDDILECRSCGAYEDVLFGEHERRTFLKSGAETKRGFIVVNQRNYSRRNKRAVRLTTSYKYICGVCGIHQAVRFSWELPL